LSDTRNSKVVDLYNMISKSFIVDVYDPYASKEDVFEKYKIHLIDFNNLKKQSYDCIIIAVGHNEFININIDSFCVSKSSLIYDLKGIYNNKKYMRL